MPVLCGCNLWPLADHEWSLCAERLPMALVRSPSQSRHCRGGEPLRRDRTNPGRVQLFVSCEVVMYPADTLSQNAH
jgi:hypothetical protein